MKKKWYNLPRITLVLLLLSTIIGTLYLYQFAPARANNIGNATIRTGQTTHLILNGNQFHCPNADGNANTLTCSIELEGKSLEMANGRYHLWQPYHLSLSKSLIHHYSAVPRMD